MIKNYLHAWPLYGWMGLGMVLIFWVLNWSLPGLRTDWAFFPLWMGYCLTVDALVYIRKKSSLLTRSPAAYLDLFLISAPAWWLFELLNLRTQNWVYQGGQYFTPAQYFLMASISFSTVMPAVFGTAELVSTFKWVKHMRRGPVIQPRPRVLLISFFGGCAMLALLLIWPRTFFPFLWLSMYFILESINCWLGFGTLAKYTANGDWRPIIALWVGCLICAFFWEMWNYYSFPKWIYQVPAVNFLHIFEMPLLGYGGYLPFALELYAIYQLAMGLIKRTTLAQEYIQLGSEDRA